jgi:hypothetical protein
MSLILAAVLSLPVVGGIIALIIVLGLRKKEKDESND